MKIDIDKLERYELCGECIFKVGPSLTGAKDRYYCILLNRLMYPENGDTDVISPIECPKYRGDEIG